jgi:nitroreductase
MDIASIDKVLTTTRSVRLRLDLERPVERDVIEDCLNIAIQAPTGSNLQGWHFMVVTDVEKRAKIADYYRKAWEGYKAQSAEGQKPPANRAELRQVLKVVKSAQYLADHMHEVPVFVIPCIEGRVEGQGVVSQASLYGSILPAAWSFMLALRARGLGASWTTLHLIYEK